MAIAPEILFINEEFLKKYTQLNEAVDTNLIRPAIYLAQDKYITLWLGTNLSNKIKDDIFNNTLAGVYETLLNEYIVKPTAWWTMVELYPMLMYKHDNGNLVTRQSENTTAITQGELSALRDMARENANYYTQMLVDYLCANSGSFPEYSTNTSPEKTPLRVVNRQSQVAFSRSMNNMESPWSRFNVRDFTN
jgi:hypothetical protein